MINVDGMGVMFHKEVKGKMACMYLSVVRKRIVRPKPVLAKRQLEMLG